MPDFSRRDFLKIGGLTLLGLAANPWIPHAEDQQPNFTAPLVWHGSRKYKRLAFTYDDCYLLYRMRTLEELLDQYPEFKVTFFPVGAKVINLDEQDPGIWKRLTAKGHEIGYHSFDHVNLGVMSRAGVLADYDKWYAALTQVLGGEYPVRFVRPPYDIISPALDILCQERGLVAALFSVGGGGEPEVVFNAIQKAQGGDIVQMHIRTDDYNSSVLAFPWLQENNWELVTMSQLYDDYLRNEINPPACDVNAGNNLTRTCLE
ncbi:MAG: polysaccharide deacetylase family protein [Anaerolineales bacterium]|nr:polysaccharide deacetylase family protein [Anaerolineales bacterium]